MILICTGLRSSAKNLAEAAGIKDWKHVTHTNQIRGLKDHEIWIPHKTLFTETMCRLIYRARKQGMTIKFVDEKGNEVEARENFGAIGKRKADRFA